MTDSDDTDVLLLIPPDFFYVPSSDDDLISSNHYRYRDPSVNQNVVHSLIAQVNTLQSRVSQIEKSKSDSTSFKHISPKSQRSPTRNLPSGIRYRRKMNSMPNTPMKQTPQKGMQNSLPSTPSSSWIHQQSFNESIRYDPSGNSYDSLNNTPPKYKAAPHLSPVTDQDADESSMTDHADSIVLNEIDQFLQNVKVIKSHLNEPIQPRNDGDKSSKKRFEDVKETKVIAFPREAGDFQCSTSNKENIKETNAYNPRGPDSYNFDKNGRLTTEDQCEYRFEIESIPSEEFKRYVVTDSKSSSDSKTLSGNLQMFESKIAKSVDDPSLVDKWKTLTEPKDVIKSDTQTESGEPVLLSLDKIWNSAPTCDNFEVMVQQKLEEERMRREHCERLIEALQVRLLESQEKITVAIKVDKVKDEAIIKLRDTCLTAQERCIQYQRAHEKIQHEMEALKSKFVNDTLETEKKMKNCEEDISRAMNMAQMSEKQTDEYKKEIHKLKLSLEDAIYRNQQLVSKFDEEIQENRRLLNETRATAAENHKLYSIARMELKSVVDEKLKLEQELNDERTVIKKLQSDRSSLELLLNESKTNENKLREETEKFAYEIEKIQSELREFYQKQVDTVVNDKLREFQAQLDTAESAFQEQIQSAKLDVAQRAVKYIHDAINKHKLEMQLVEQRHEEEKGLFNLKYEQALEKIHQLKKVLNKQHTNRVHLAKRLHQLMESQWREAIKLVNNNMQSGLSTSVGSGSEINLMTNSSCADIEKILCDHQDISKHDDLISQEIPTSDRVKTEATSQDEFTCSEHSDIPFSREGQETYRLSDKTTNIQNLPLTETPVTSRGPKIPNSQNMMDLHKYMKIVNDLIKTDR